MTDTQTTRHLAHVRVRHFATGDPVLALSCDERLTNDLSGPNAWTSGGVVAKSPQEAGWLYLRELGAGDEAVLYAAAVDLVSYEIRPLFTGPSAVQPVPHDDLYHALKFETWPDELVDAFSLTQMSEAALRIQNDSDTPEAYQGVFFVATFTVAAEEGRYTSVRFEGLVGESDPVSVLVPDLV